MGRCAVCGEFAIVGWGAKSLPLCQRHFEMKLKEVRKTMDKVEEIVNVSSG